MRVTRPWLAALIAFPNFYFVDLELEMYPVTIRYCPGKSHQLSSSFDIIFPCISISISMRLHIDEGKLEDILKKPFRKTGHVELMPTRIAKYTLVPRLLPLVEERTW